MQLFRTSTRKTVDEEDADFLNEAGVLGALMAWAVDETSSMARGQRRRLYLSKVSYLVPAKSSLSYIWGTDCH